MISTEKDAPITTDSELTKRAEKIKVLKENRKVLRRGMAIAGTIGGEGVFGTEILLTKVLHALGAETLIHQAPKILGAIPVVAYGIAAYAANENYKESLANQLGLTPKGARRILRAERAEKAKASKITRR